MIKCASIISNDNLSKETLSLFLFEKQRKNSVCESLYLCNFLKLFDSTPTSIFRILYSPAINVISIHMIEKTFDHYKKEYIENFQEFLNVILINKCLKISIIFIKECSPGILRKTKR